MLACPSLPQVSCSTIPIIRAYRNMPQVFGLGDSYRPGIPQFAAGFHFGGTGTRPWDGCHPQHEVGPHPLPACHQERGDTEQRWASVERTSGHTAEYRRLS